MQKLDINITQLEHHRGMRFSVYSRAMKCEFPVQRDNLIDTIINLFNEWRGIVEMETGIPDAKQPKRRILIGRSPQDSHSFKDCSSLDEAICWMWALANCKNPVRVWHFAGADGWQSNAHMKKKEFPPHLAQHIQEFIDEDNTVVCRASIKQRQSC